MPINTYILGTAIKISVLINVATATTALITIEDPSDIDEVTDGTMTKDGDGVYSYTWQSATTDDDGKYKVTVKITSGGYTSVKVAYFVTVDPDDL